MNNLRCPPCGLSHIKKNGHTYYGKQNHQCPACGRQFVADSQRVTADERERIQRLLLERLSLRGICRVMDVSLRWLLTFIAELYESLPDDLNVTPPGPSVGHVKLLRLRAEADEMWSFVGRKANKQWVWIAIDTETRQLIAFHVGDLTEWKSDLPVGMSHCQVASDVPRSGWSNGKSAKPRRKICSSYSTNSRTTS
ncbi:MAG: IS1 family transposase [Acidobacteriota bacterium]|nr:IS1 family transposase [Acidobacteriota bacterium]